MIRRLMSRWFNTKYAGLFYYPGQKGKMMIGRVRHLPGGAQYVQFYSHPVILMDNGTTKGSDVWESWMPV